MKSDKVNRELNCKPEDLLLYAVTDRKWLGDDTLSDQVKATILGGSTFVQLREKDLNEEDFYREAVEIQELCRQYNIPFVVNDNVDIAIKMDADGVHVGQSDMNAESVRDKIGPNKILGVSAQTVEQALLAEEQGADYLGVGSVLNTKSKDDAEEVSFDTLKAICKAVSIPVIAIGGISMSNLDKLKGSGICGIAVISAIFAQEDIRQATIDLKKKTIEMLEG